MEQKKLLLTDSKGDMQTDLALVSKHRIFKRTHQNLTKTAPFTKNTVSSPGNWNDTREKKRCKLSQILGVSMETM